MANETNNQAADSIKSVSRGTEKWFMVNIINPLLSYLKENRDFIYWIVAFLTVTSPLLLLIKVWGYVGYNLTVWITLCGMYFIFALFFVIALLKANLK